MMDLETIDYNKLTQYLISYGVINNKIISDTLELLILIANYYNITDKSVAESILANVDRTYLEIKTEDLIRNKKKKIVINL